MAERQIQYCKTSEGRSIAYVAMGSGPVLVATSASLGSTIARELEMDSMRRISELTARNYTYVRFDPHACGLSDRRDDDLSVESFVRDIEAVADATSREPFILFANGALTGPAIQYAALYPDRLTRLVLWVSFARGSDYAGGPDEQITQLALKDWRLASESMIRAADNWEHEEMASQMAEHMRESVTPETYVKFEAARREWDVSEYLSRVRTPTLVAHPRNHQYYPPATAQRVAAEIPGARLALIDSATVLFPDPSIAFVVGEFLGTPARSQAPRGDALPAAGSASAVILFTDIVDSTALTERLGDARFRELSRALDAGLRAAIRDAGGVAVEGKLLGDGVLATFGSAAQAIDGARRCVEMGSHAGLPLHVGLHAGDVIREQDDVFGGAVNIAARICGLSAPGEILVSDVVRGMARTSAGVVFEDRGEREMKGVGEAVRVYAVRTDGVVGGS